MPYRVCGFLFNNVKISETLKVSLGKGRSGLGAAVFLSAAFVIVDSRIMCGDNFAKEKIASLECMPHDRRSIVSQNLF